MKDISLGFSVASLTLTAVPCVPGVACFFSVFFFGGGGGVEGGGKGGGCIHSKCWVLHLKQR